MPILNKSSNRFINDKNTRVSVGIDLPVSISPGTDGFFTTTKTTIDSIKADIKMLLMTERGERVFQPALGMNIRKYLFEQITEETISVLQQRLSTDIANRCPIVEVQNLVVTPQSDLNVVNIVLTYNVLNLENEVIEINIENTSGAY